MKAVLAYPSWYEIEKGCAILARKALTISESDPYECVVGLTRGGLIPAVSISHMLSLPMIPVCYSSKEGQGDNQDHSNELPELPYKRILIVDDIIDSGSTIEEVYRHYHVQPNSGRIDVAVLYWKCGAAWVPDMAWQEIPEDAPWIVFPWEV